MIVVSNIVQHIGFVDDDEQKLGKGIREEKNCDWKIHCKYREQLLFNEYWPCVDAHINI